MEVLGKLSELEPLIKAFEMLAEFMPEFEVKPLVLQNKQGKKTRYIAILLKSKNQPVEGEPK